MRLALSLSLLLLTGCATTVSPTPSSAPGIKRFSILDTAKRRPPVAAKHRSGRHSLPVASRSLRRSRVESRPSRSPLPVPPVTHNWTAVAACESGNDWQANTGNGYYGGVQADLTFWASYGGLAFAARPDLATRAQQIAVAERGLAVQGAGSWPICGAYL